MSENTKLYFLVKDSVDISGAYEQLDTDHINKSFVGAAGSRSLRDGLGFLNWVESFFDITKDDAQILLKRQFASKMKINPTGASIAVLEKTWLDGLSIWKRITGNDEYERVSLQTYYLAIRDGLPDKPFEARTRSKRRALTTGTLRRRSCTASRHQDLKSVTSRA